MQKRGMSFFSIIIIIGVIIFTTMIISKVYSVDYIENEDMIEENEVAVLKTLTDNFNIEAEDSRSRKIRKAIESRRWNRKRRKIYYSICIFKRRII